MKYIKLSHNQYCLRIIRGEEILTTINTFCKKQKIIGGYFSGIGATNNVTIGIYNEKSKKYLSTTLKGSWEITSLIGNISFLKQKPFSQEKYELH